MACYGCTRCGKCMTFKDSVPETCLCCGEKLDARLPACPNCGAPTPPPAGFSSWGDAQETKELTAETA